METLPNSNERSPDSELVSLVGGEVADLCQELGVDEDTLKSFREDVVPSVEISRTEDTSAFFNKTLTLGEKSVRTRTELLDRELEGYNLDFEVVQRLAEEWIVAHELTHALEDAYSLAHPNKQPDQELNVAANLVEDILSSNPKYPESMSKPGHPRDAHTVESERLAEGIAQQHMWAKFEELNIPVETRKGVFESLTEESRRKTQLLKELLAKTDKNTDLSEVYNGELDADGKKDSHFVIHYFGYANPLTKAELKERFEVIS